MHGSRFSSAISCARRCFFTVIGRYEPPFTVASFATTMTWRPCTVPMPVTSPALGAPPSYMPFAHEKLAARGVALHLLGATALLDQAQAVAEVRGQDPVMFGVRAEFGAVRIEVRLQAFHVGCPSLRCGGSRPRGALRAGQL